MLPGKMDRRMAGVSSGSISLQNMCNVNQQVFVLLGRRGIFCTGKMWLLRWEKHNLPHL